jgi:hypothetical protein
MMSLTDKDVQGNLCAYNKLVIPKRLLHNFKDITISIIQIFDNFYLLEGKFIKIGRLLNKGSRHEYETRSGGITPPYLTSKLVEVIC